MAAVLDFREIGQIVRGALEPGKLKLVPDCVAFKASHSGQVRQFSIEDVKSFGWMRVAKGFELKIFLKDGNIVKFDGFKEQDYHNLVEFSKKHYGKDIPETEVSIKGWNWGEVKFDDSLLSFKVDNRTAFEIPLQEVSQVSTGKNEVTLEFHQGDNTPVSLLEMRFYVPNAGDDEDPVKTFYDKVMTKANVLEATGDAIAVFEELQVLTPRGRYDFTAYPTFLHLHGKTYDYKITYNSINRQFLLPHIDQRQMFFVFSLDPPLRQGQTRYPFVIMQFSLEDECSLTLPIDEEVFSKYGGQLQKEMTGPLHEVFSKVMRAMVGKKITVPGSFKGPSGQAAVSCSHKATSGMLYPLDKGFLFIHKPAVFLKYEDIGQVNFARVAGASGVSRSFDLEVELKNGTSFAFSSMIKDDYGHLYDFITNKGIRVKNKGKESGVTGKKQDIELDPYLERMKAEGEIRDSEDEDSDFEAKESSEDDLEFDSDAEVDSESDQEEKKEPIVRKRKAEKSSQPAKRKKDVPKNKKDPNAPKKPLSAYMLWLQDNRSAIKKESPNASVTEIAKLAGEKWKLVDASEKSEYVERAAELKKQYRIDVAKYAADGGSSDKTTSPNKKSKTSKKTKSPKKMVSDNTKYKSVEYIEDSDEELAEEDDDQQGSTKGHRPDDDVESSSVDDDSDASDN